MPTDIQELGNLIGKNVRDTDDMNQSMSHSAGEDTNIIFPTNTFEIKQLTARAKQRLIGTAFILGHADNGVLGTDELGAGTMGSFTTIRVVSPNNIFWEYFASTSYQDTTNTTASINTTNEEASFTSNKVYQTSLIFKNNADITLVKPTINIRSASATLNVTAGTPQRFDLVID